MPNEPIDLRKMFEEEVYTQQFGERKSTGTVVIDFSDREGFKALGIKAMKTRPSLGNLFLRALDKLFTWCRL